MSSADDARKLDTAADANRAAANIGGAIGGAFIPGLGPLIGKAGESISGIIDRESGRADREAAVRAEREEKDFLAKERLKDIALDREIARQKKLREAGVTLDRASRFDRADTNIAKAPPASATAQGPRALPRAPQAMVNFEDDEAMPRGTSDSDLAYFRSVLAQPERHNPQVVQTYREMLALAQQVRVAHAQVQRAKVPLLQPRAYEDLRGAQTQPQSRAARFDRAVAKDTSHDAPEAPVNRAARFDRADRLDFSQVDRGIADLGRSSLERGVVGPRGSSTLDFGSLDSGIAGLGRRSSSSSNYGGGDSPSNLNFASLDSGIAGLGRRSSSSNYGGGDSPSSLNFASLDSGIAGLGGRGSSIGGDRPSSDDSGDSASSSLDFGSLDSGIAGLGSSGGSGSGGYSSDSDSGSDSGGSDNSEGEG